MEEINLINKSFPLNVSTYAKVVLFTEKIMQALSGNWPI